MQAVFDAIGSFFTDLLRLITDWARWLLDVVVQIFVDLGELALDVVWGALDSIISVAVGLLSALPAPSFDLAGALGGLPAEMINVAGLIGLGQAIGIVIAALGVRFVLQMIPFVRWGS
ncbi:hypothetical protein MIN45_P1888 [Methylomarinovum tepidoasis]|uniref:DUF2523 domain-containing protein n=1 Tax=Methylomarinovum tepidoasis TaxID=2840183 RepID=A0AAU9CXS0_9GAMM|nr:DUF2523 family protein [Methylomarinovum sp. IN45]BCX89515.1 hypothetical protein MIN45_P1888 [Methylomarinovum sp. IN45]